MDIIGDTLSPLFDYLEQEIIADVARRIKKTATYTRTAELHALSLRKLGYSPDRIRSEAMKMLRADAAYRKEVALNTAQYKNKISKLIQEITNKAYKEGKKIIAGAGDMAWYSDLRVWRDAGKDLTTDRAQLEQLVRSMYTQLNGELNNLTRTTGFNTVSGFESVKNLYINELDKATIKLMSGTSSQDQVVRDCILSLAKSGLKCVNYDSGRKDQLDVAVKRALRTGIHQMAGNIQDYNLTEMGENLVYVQEHAGARNKGSGIANHAQWQGKVYYIKPGHEYSEEEARLGYQIRDLWECTGYSVDGAHENNPLGLFGYNCRHLYFPWFEGISELPEPQPEKNTVMHNGREIDFYAQTQELRKQERNIRSLKREQDALERLGLDHRDTEAKLEEAERKYSAFCRKCKIPETSTNTNYESSTSDITKTKAYKKYLRECDKNNEFHRKKDNLNRRRREDGNEVIDIPTYNKLTNKFIKNGGIIIRGKEAEEHLGEKYSAAYLPSFNAAFIKDKPTISEVLEEMYHAEQDRTNMYGEVVTREVLLLREIDAQKYLLLCTEKYKIPLREVEITERNLKDYEDRLKSIKKRNGK